MSDVVESNGIHASVTGRHHEREIEMMNELQTIDGSTPYSIRTDRYSAKRMTKPVNFYCVALEAKAVFLIGDFNGWQIGANPMARQPDGSWWTQVELHHGHHPYQFVVDGQPVLDSKACGIARNEKNEHVSLIAVS